MLQLRFWRHDHQLAHNWMVASSQASGGKMLYPAVFVELRDASGVIGLGEAAPSHRYGETAETCLAFLQQVDARRLSINDIDGSMRYIDSIAAGNYSPKGA